MSQAQVEKITSYILRGTIALFTLFFLYESASYLLIDYPFNQYEPEVVIDAWALSQGQYLYPARSVGPIAGLYAPFYHITVALFFQFLPNTLLTARFVTFLALLGAVFILKRSSVNLPFSTIIAFFGILIWHVTLLDFDMHAKPDTYSVFLGMLSVFMLIKKEKYTNLDLFLSALIASLSVATKQSMLFAPVGIGLYLISQKEFRATLTFGVSFLVSTITVWFIFYKTLGPDMLFFVFEQPASFGISFVSLSWNTWYIQGVNLWFIFIVLNLVLYQKNLFSKKSILLNIVTLIALPASILTASKSGGMSNAYQPFYYFLIWSLLYTVNQNWEDGLKIKELLSRYKIVFNGSMILVLWLTLNPNIPSKITSVGHRIQINNDYSKLADELHKLEGNLYVPMDNYLSLKAEKPFRWSMKWELETPLRNQNRPINDFSSLATNFDNVVTTLNYSWSSDIKIESGLKQLGFKQLSTYKMGLDKEYHVWHKTKEQVNQD